jgi:hypothetical protein
MNPEKTQKQMERDLPLDEAFKTTDKVNGEGRKSLPSQRESCATYSSKNPTIPSVIHHQTSLVVATSRKCQSTAIEADCEDREDAKTKARTDPRCCLVPSRPARFARGRCLPPEA